MGSLIKWASAGGGGKGGFDMLLTADNSIRYQQNLKGRKIAIVVHSSPRWPLVRLQTEKIVAAIDLATPGSYREVITPFV